MKIRLHEADFNFNPTDGTAKIITGKTAMDIVEGMKDSPFTESVEICQYMRDTLRRIGRDGFVLPEDTNAACAAFLQELVNLGFANYEPEIPKLTPEQKDALLEEEKRYRTELKQINIQYPFSDRLCDYDMMEARSNAFWCAREDHEKIVAQIYGIEEIKTMAGF